MTEITLKEAIEAIAHKEVVYVADSRCKNLVEARNLSIKWRPRLRRYDVTYKVALWWRSFSVSSPDTFGFWVNR